MYIKRLLVRNLRSIRESELKFRYPGDRESAGETNNVNLLLGDNGTGKTTLLSGIAMVALSRVLEGSGFRPYFLVRRGDEGEGGSVYAEVVLRSEDLAEGSGKEHAGRMANLRPLEFGRCARSCAKAVLARPVP